MQTIPAVSGPFQKVEPRRLSRVQVRYDDTGDFLFFNTGTGKSHKLCASAVSRAVGKDDKNVDNFLGYVVSHPGVWHDAPFRQQHSRTRFDRVPSTIVQ